MLFRSVQSWTLGLTLGLRHLPFPLPYGHPPALGSLPPCGVFSLSLPSWGPQCSKSCSSGTRRRQVVCALGPPGRCGSLQPSKPPAVEACNTQPCDLPPGKHGEGQLEPGPASSPAGSLASTSCPCACALSPLDHPPLRSPCVRPLPSAKASSWQPHRAAVWPPGRQHLSVTPRALCDCWHTWALQWLCVAC